MRHRSDKWDLVENPAWAGRAPQALAGSECHDHSHFVTIQCSCGEQMHMHETQTRSLPKHLGVGSMCKGCGDLLTFEPGFFRQTFATMRKQGWIT